MVNNRSQIFFVDGPSDMWDTYLYKCYMAKPLPVIVSLLEEGKGEIKWKHTRGDSQDKDPITHPLNPHTHREIQDPNPKNVGQITS